MDSNPIKQVIINKPRQFLQKTFDRFVRIRGNPRDIALGFALGIFIGFSPTMGIQIWSAVFIAALLKWNKIAAATGVWITNPLTATAIYGMTYVTGAKILGFEKLQQFTLELSISNLQTLIAKAPKVFGAMIVGGIAMGTPLAVIAYYIAFYLVQHYQSRVKEKIIRQKAKLSNTKTKLKDRLQKRRKKNKRTIRP